MLQIISLRFESIIHTNAKHKKNVILNKNTIDD